MAETWKPGDPLGEGGSDEDQLREALADALATHRPRGVRTDDTIKVVVDDMVDEALMPIVRPLLVERDRLRAGRENERTMLRNAATQIMQVRGLAESKATSARALGRGDEERGWLDVLAILGRGPEGDDA